MTQTSLGLGFRARSSSFAVSPSPALPGAQLVLPGGAQLDLSLERLFGPWAVSAFVHNVFDRQLYETQSNPGNIPLEPRRSFGLMASYSRRAWHPEAFSTGPGRRPPGAGMGQEAPLAFALEVFKTSAGIKSWSYPDFAYSKVFGVPLFSGFM